MYIVKARVVMFLILTLTQEDDDDEAEEVVLPWRTPQSGGPPPRQGHGRAVRAKQARVCEVGTVTGTRLFRIGGLLVFVGAVTFVLHVVLRSVLTAGVDPAVSAQAGLWVPVNVLGALGAALVLLGLPAVYARMAGEGGMPGLVGFALIAAA